MSNIYKAIIPLIDNNISLEDIQDGTFAGCFIEDKNRPWLDNHVFLLYKWGENKSTKIFYKFRQSKSFYGYKVMYINGESYIVYTFTSNTNVNRLKKGNAILGDVSKLRILRFWQYKDDWVTWNIARGTVMGDPASGTVPEEDYLEE